MGKATECILLFFIIVFVIGIIHCKDLRLGEHFDYFPKETTLNNLQVPCDLQYQPKRYMYQAIPPSHNTSYDIRNPPSFIGPADDANFGAFSHTDIFGNYRDARVCPNIQTEQTLP